MNTPADIIFTYSDRDAANECAKELRAAPEHYAKVRVVSRTVSAFGCSDRVSVVAAWYTDAARERYAS